MPHIVGTQLHRPKNLPEQPMFPRSFEETNWLHIAILTIPPALSIYGFITTPITKPTLIWYFITYYFCGFGITGGYHRLWAHRAFSASKPLKWWLACWGAAAFEGSIPFWCGKHRVHHRYVDTHLDPYNATRGFFYSHLGWMLFKVKKSKKADITDLTNDPIIRWQHKYYLPIALFFSVIIPTCVSTLWNDPWGGFFFACMFRITCVHHSTFFVNSLAHYFGDKPFSAYETAFDSFITALLTLGEGYHNLHHAFAQDYRNAIKFWQYDPTKWTILVLEKLGLAYDLKYFTDEEIEKARLQQRQLKLNAERYQLKYGSLAALPQYSWTEFLSEVNENAKKWVVVAGAIHDVEDFADQHPGGRATLLKFVGKDATYEFNNGLPDHAHQHTEAAEKFMAPLRVGRICVHSFGPDQTQEDDQELSAHRAALTKSPTTIRERVSRLNKQRE